VEFLVDLNEIFSAFLKKNGYLKNLTKLYIKYSLEIWRKIPIDFPDYYDQISRNLYEHLILKFICHP
jgi:hypothetical protein